MKENGNIVDFYLEAKKRGRRNLVPPGLSELDNRCLLDLERVAQVRKILIEKYDFDPRKIYTQKDIEKLQMKYPDVANMDRQGLIDLINTKTESDYLIDIEKFLLVYVRLVESGLIDRG